VCLEWCLLFVGRIKGQRVRKGAFTYSGSMSLGKGFIKPLRRVQAFLDRCTQCSEPDYVCIYLYEGHDTPADFSSFIISEMKERYEIYGWTDLGRYMRHQWVATQEELYDIAERLEGLRPIMKTEVGPLELYVKYFFQLTDDSGVALEFQNPVDYANFVSQGKSPQHLGISRFDLHLSENSTGRLDLTVPIESSGVHLQQYLETLKSNSGLKFKSTGWKQWTLTKGGGGYRGRKIEL